MKKLLKRFSRVADSSQYSLLRSDARPPRTPTFCRFNNGMPAGHLPVYVGQQMQRYVINTTLLSNPIFIQLLNKVAEEYGYQLDGVLHIPCNVHDFETLLTAATQNGLITPLIQDILNNL